MIFQLIFCQKENNNYLKKILYLYYNLSRYLDRQKSIFIGYKKNDFKRVAQLMFLIEIIIMKIFFFELLEVSGFIISLILESSSIIIQL